MQKWVLRFNEVIQKVEKRRSYDILINSNKWLRYREKRSYSVYINLNYKGKDWNKYLNNKYKEIVNNKQKHKKEFKD